MQTEFAKVTGRVAVYVGPMIVVCVEVMPRFADGSLDLPSLGRLCSEAWAAF